MQRAGEARGLIREASLEEERQKVREQSGLSGAATEQLCDPIR